MGPRTTLHEILKEVLGSGQVYFQPPESIRMVYPSIVYRHMNNKTLFANDLTYNHRKLYELIAIDRDPDSELPDKLMRLPLCSMTNSYTAENLHHWVFQIYF